jgi:DeoR/GlpR family transcriptional regulator of sugar metabolism
MCAIRVIREIRSYKDAMQPRHQAILDLLTTDAAVSVQQLATRLQVTPATIRRDFDALQAAGRLERTHGGAVLSRPGCIEFRMRSREQLMAAEKRAIAAAAARLVRPGMTLALDTGTTTLEVARAIAGTTDLRVLTSSLAVAAALHPHPGIRLVLLGGQARTDEPDLFGELTEENLKRFHVDLAFIGADRITPAGLHATDPDVVRVSRAMLLNADTSVLVADHTKFGSPAFYRFGTWEEIDTVITDAGLPAEVQKWLRRKAKLVLAGGSD